MKYVPVLLIIFLMSTCTMARDFSFSKTTVHDTDYTKGKGWDTLYVKNLTDHTIYIDSMYLDTKQIVNSQILPTGDSDFGAAYFTTFTLNTTTTYAVYHSISYPKQIAILPNDSIGFTKLNFEITFPMVKKTAANQSTDIKKGDTATLELVMKTSTTVDTLICIGLIMHPITGVVSDVHQVQYVKKQKAAIVVNAKGQCISEINVKKNTLLPVKTFTNPK